MSLTSRLFLAMVICRAFMLGPQPCNRCWVKLRLSDEVVAGLKSLRGLLLLTPVLFNPRLRVVPVRNDCWIAKLAIFCCWMSSLLPVLNDCGPGVAGFSVSASQAIWMYWPKKIHSARDRACLDSHFLRMAHKDSVADC